MTLSYISPTIWSKISDMLKQTNNLNMFKLNLKEHYLKELKSSNSCQPFILKTIVCNIPSFQFICSFQIGIIPLLLRDHNVNTSNMMHVLCYPAVSKGVMSLSILINITFLTLLSQYLSFLIQFLTISLSFFIFSSANTHLLAILHYKPEVSAKSPKIITSPPHSRFIPDQILTL